jgi:hypothetical protein
MSKSFFLRRLLQNEADEEYETEIVTEIIEVSKADAAPAMNSKLGSTAESFASTIRTTVASIQHTTIEKISEFEKNKQLLDNTAKKLKSKF